MKFDEYMKTVFDLNNKLKEESAATKPEPEPVNRPRPTLTASFMALTSKKK